MATTKTKVTIEKPVVETIVDVDGKLENRKKLAGLLKEKLERVTKELETKKYLVEGGEEIGRKLVDFITNEAEWKFTESMGIVETLRHFNEGIKDLVYGKRKELMLPALAIEATYYFLTKKTGVGLQAAEDYIKILKPVSDGLSRSKVDNEALNQLTKDLGTVQSAIDTGSVSEMEEQMLLEIEAETVK